MSFIQSFKAISAKINSIAKDMDEKVDTFADEVLSIITDYDEDFFSRAANDADEDKANMKSAIKKLFDMFKPEEKKKSVNGFIVYCNENREDCIRNNAGKKPTEITSILGQQWKALDKDEQSEYNAKAKSVKPLTDEEKKAKNRARSSSRKPAAEKVKCEFDDCDKTVKEPKPHTDGKCYCYNHFKKVLTEEKKASIVKCSHESKDGKKCSSEAIDGTWCARHLKKDSSPKVSPKASPKASPKSEKEEKPEKKSVSKKSEKEEAPASPQGTTCDYKTVVKINQDNEYWSCKSITLQGKRFRFHKQSGLVLEMEKPILKGTYINKEFKHFKDMDAKIKKWAIKCGIEEEEVEMELDSDEE